MTRYPTILRSHKVAWLLATLGALGCGATQQHRPAAQRSPSLDYQQPITTTASGRSLGADRVSAADKLEQGPRVGTGNALAPGWKVDERGLSYDERRRVGGATSAQVELRHDH